MKKKYVPVENSNAFLKWPPTAQLSRPAIRASRLDINTSSGRQQLAKGHLVGILFMGVFVSAYLTQEGLSPRPVCTALAFGFLF